MRNFNDVVTDYTTLSKDGSAANIALGKILINQSVKRVLNMRNWTFNRGSFTDATEEEVSGYPLPYNCERMIGVKITNSIDYWPKEVVNRDNWVRLNRTEILSDIPERFYIDQITGKLEIYPTPSTADLAMVMYFQKLIIDLSEANYTTGTVTVALKSTTVTGSGTTFTAAMVGRYIQIGADGYWYEIVGYTSATVITIKSEPRVAAAGAAIIVAELIPFPSGFENIPLYEALMKYFRGNEQQSDAREWEREMNHDIELLMKRDAKTTENMMLDDGMVGIVDPNDYPLITE